MSVLPNKPRICLQHGARTSSLQPIPAAAAAKAAAIMVRLSHHELPRHHMQSPAAHRVQSPAAHAISLDASQMGDAVPYVSKRASKLEGRRLAANPLEALWQTAAQAALQGELLLAVLVDKHRWAAFLMAAAAGAMASLGLDASSLLQHGLPAYMPDLLLAAVGAWDVTLWAVALTAAAVPVTLWALRVWCRANSSLLQHSAGALQQLVTQQQLGEDASSSSSSSSSTRISGWAAAATAAAVTALRGVCLCAATNALISLLYTKSSSAAATVTNWGIACVAVGVAVAALILPQHHGSNSSSSSSASGRLLAPLLATEAAWVAAVVCINPWVSATAAVVMAGGLLLLHQGAVVPALQQYRAAAGDIAEVRVGLKLAGTRPVFDATPADQPLRVQVAPVPDELLQLWQGAANVDSSSSSGGDSSRSEQEGQQQQSDSAAQGLGGGGEGEARQDVEDLSDLQRELQGWLTRPMARWEVLRPFVADAAEGLFVGETVCVPLYNPRLIGYWNPSFSWWQPAAEVAAKFNGQLPGVGDVFWYPVVDGAAVPTRVNAVGRDYVELDANYGVTDTALELQVQLVRLQKSEH